MISQKSYIEKDRYRAITFDMGSTLEYSDPPIYEVFDQICRELNLKSSVEDIMKGMRLAWARLGPRYLEHNGEVEEGFWLDFDRILLKEMGNEGDLDLPLQEMRKKLRQRADRDKGDVKWYCPSEVHGLLSDLKRRGYILGVVSNWDQTLETVCEGHRIKDYFHFILASKVVGAEKPNPRIFEMAIKAAGTSAAQMAHVGDIYYADVMGARRAGLTPVLLDPVRFFPEADCPRIDKLEEITDLLGLD